MTCCVDRIYRIDVEMLTLFVFCFSFASLHLFDLIKGMYGYKSVNIMVADKRVADLELEYVFRYGTFGYGYSHELEQNNLTVAQIMNESMFFRRK